MSTTFISTGNNQKEAVLFLNELFEYAARERVPDVHFHRTDKGSCIKIRVPGGALVFHKDIPNEWMMVIDEKIRSKAQLSTSDRRSPLDGRISLAYGELEIDVRVAISPGVGVGLLIVCRILNQSNSNIKLENIGMPVMVREALRRVVEEPHGLFIVCGPTGSGKTTTLYALLNELNDGTRNIITVENPVEYRISDFHQINVDGMGMTFAGALRTVLRQDPDVIMVGEIRDNETAAIAVQAAMTGHLVLTTIHANNAALAITRLVDMGVDAASLNGALRGVVAQRLVRTIKPDAAVTKLKPNETEITWLRLNDIHRQDDTLYPHLIDPIHGFKGVTPVMEVILADWRVRKVMAKGEAEIYLEASRQPQFETLAQAAERLAYSGITTLDEARHLTSGQEGPSIQNKRLGQVLVAQNIISQDDLEDMLENQSILKSSGEHKKLGRLLIEANMCSKEQIFKAVGYTAEAKDVLLRIARTDEFKQKLYTLFGKWAQGHSSLFDMACAASIANEKDIFDAYDC